MQPPARSSPDTISDSNAHLNRSVAAIIVRDRMVLLALRLPGGAIGGLWEFPGGKADEDETDPQALIRELREELGVGARVHELLAEGRFAHRGVPFGLFAYRVSFEPSDAAHFVLSEHSETRWVPWDDVSSFAMPESDHTVWPDVLAGLREREATMDVRPDPPADSRSD